MSLKTDLFCMTPYDVQIIKGMNIERMKDIRQNLYKHPLRGIMVRLYVCPSFVLLL